MDMNLKENRKKGDNCSFERKAIRHACCLPSLEGALFDRPCLGAAPGLITSTNREQNSGFKSHGPQITSKLQY